MDSTAVVICSECGVGKFPLADDGYLECTHCGAEATILDFHVEDGESLVMLPEVNFVLCVVKLERA